MRFTFQLYAGVDQYSLGGSWLTDCLNTSVATYEIGPAFTLMELEIIKFCSSKIGWNAEQSDGVFAPGNYRAFKTADWRPARIGFDLTIS